MRWIIITPYFQFPWWRHQMETFSALLVLCEKNSPVTAEFPPHSPVMGRLDVFFDLRLNKRSSKPHRRRWFEAPSRSLWRHCNALYIFDTSIILNSRKCIQILCIPCIFLWWRTLLKKSDTFVNKGFIIYDAHCVSNSLLMYPMLLMVCCRHAMFNINSWTTLLRFVTLGPTRILMSWWYRSGLIWNYNLTERRTVCRIDTDTAYVVCTSVSLGFPYMVSVLPCFPYMVMLPKHLNAKAIVRDGALPLAAMDHYCDVTMIRPLLFDGIRADLSGSRGAAIVDNHSISHMLEFKLICHISL